MFDVGRDKTSTEDENREDVMAIKIRCPCGKVYRASSQLAGKKVRCRTCGAVLPIPLSGPPPRSERDVDQEWKYRYDFQTIRERSIWGAIALSISLLLIVQSCFFRSTPVEAQRFRPIRSASDTSSQTLYLATDHLTGEFDKYNVIEVPFEKLQPVSNLSHFLKVDATINGNTKTIHQQAPKDWPDSILNERNITGLELRANPKVMFPLKGDLFRDFKVPLRETVQVRLDVDVEYPASGGVRKYSIRRENVSETIPINFVSRLEADTILATRGARGKWTAGWICFAISIVFVGCSVVYPVLRWRLYLARRDERNE